VANKVPTKTGRIALCHALTRRGGIRSEFTITKIADQHYYVVSAGAASATTAIPAEDAAGGRRVAQEHHLEPRLLRSGGTAFPRSPRQTHRHELDNASFPWLTGQVAEVGLAVDVYLLRVNFVGALGWELHFPIEYAHHFVRCDLRRRRGIHIGMAGMRAMESLRLEKSYRMWGTDLSPTIRLRGGLGSLRAHEQGEFVGKAALQRQLNDGVPHRFVTFEVHGVVDADPLGNEPCSTPKARSSAARPPAITGTRCARAWDGGT